MSAGEMGFGLAVDHGRLRTLRVFRAVTVCANPPVVSGQHVSAGTAIVALARNIGAPCGRHL